MLPHVQGQNEDVVTLVPPSPGRSRNMAAIRSRGTRPELSARRALHAAGFRYRLHYRKLAGKPDLVFPRYRLAIFVHGCFWHGHECEIAQRPRTNVAYWGPKIQGNIQRDEESVRRLRDLGWKVFIIRECQLEEGIQDAIVQLRSLQAANG